MQNAFFVVMLVSGRAAAALMVLVLAGWFIRRQDHMLAVQRDFTGEKKDLGSILRYRGPDRREAALHTVARIMQPTI